jgi:hypothetical protein
MIEQNEDDYYDNGGNFVAVLIHTHMCAPVSSGIYEFIFVLEITGWPVAISRLIRSRYMCIFLIWIEFYGTQEHTLSTFQPVTYGDE